MARFVADVRVLPRPGIADPEGHTVRSALGSLGYAGVSEVRSGKLLRIALDAEDQATADAAVADMCRRLLANPVMEVASWDVRADLPGAGAPDDRTDLEADAFRAAEHPTSSAR